MEILASVFSIWVSEILERFILPDPLFFGGNEYNRFQITDVKHCQRSPQIQISVYYLTDTKSRGISEEWGDAEIRVVESGSTWGARREH